MADAQASGACCGNTVWVQVPSPAFTRKCRNWQTSKTKDLVLVTACGFKSHLPHEEFFRDEELFFYCFREKVTDPELDSLHLPWDVTP